MLNRIVEGNFFALMGSEVGVRRRPIMMNTNPLDYSYLVKPARTFSAMLLCASAVGCRQFN